MRVIITGGTGSIGVPLANSLADANHDVIVLTRNPHHKPASLVDSIQLCGWDTQTGEGWYDLIHAETAIINLAGKSPMNWRWTDAHKQAVLDSRVGVVEAVIDACQKAEEKPAVILQASAVGYYGDTGEQEIREDSPSGDTWRAGVCRQWEATAQPLEAMGIRVVYLRIGIVLDPQAGALPPFILSAKLMGRQHGNGRQWFPWIHPDDVNGSIAFLMGRDDLSGAFNICAPNPVRNREFLQALTTTLSRPSLFPVPTFALKIAFDEMAKTILDSQRIIPQRLIDSDYSFTYPDIEPALRDLLLA